MIHPYKYDVATSNPRLNEKPITMRSTTIHNYASVKSCHPKINEEAWDSVIPYMVSIIVVKMEKYVYFAWQ